MLFQILMFKDNGAVFVIARKKSKMETELINSKK